MSSNYKRGIIVWLFGFLTILSFLNVLNSVVMWLQNGENFMFTPYLIDQYIGNINVKEYFWISTAIGFIFFGLTAIASFRNDPGIIDAIKDQKITQDELSEASHKVLRNQENLERHIDSVTLKNQHNLQSYIDNVTMKNREGLQTHIDKTGVEISKAYAKQGTIMKKMERLSNTVEKINNDLANIKERFQSLEDALLFPHPKITFESSPMEINGIGPVITKDLQSIGVTNAGEFLLTDPEIISKYTHLSLERVENLQGTVQLMMIPGIDENKIEFFKSLGVKNRNDLALQDPFEFNIKLSKVYTENEKYLKYKKPTFQEVLSWVRTAKL